MVGKTVFGFMLTSMLDLHQEISKTSEGIKQNTE